MKKSTVLSPADLEIIGSLTEARNALAQGGPGLKKLTIRTVGLDLTPRAYSAESVVRTRALLNASQGVFARLLGVSVKTVRGWELGERSPNPMARRFMDEINDSPSYWKARLGGSSKSRARGPGL